MNKKRRGMGAGSHLKWLLSIFVIVIILSLLVPTASADGWGYRKLIAIEHTKVPGDLTNFPVLISITDTDLRDKAQDDGGDIVFTNKANSTRYDHEIEKFVKSTGELVAWVEIDSLLSGTNTEIWMWYSNSGCPNQWHIEETWDNNYKLVQHLEETTGTCYDSTSNDNDGTEHGGVTQNAVGQIDGADGFDGSDDYVDFGNGASLPESTTFTVSAWVNHNKQDSSWDVITDKYKPAAGSAPHAVTLAVFLTDKEEFSFTTADTAWDANNDLKTGVISANQWHHVVAVWDAPGTDKYIYIDGDLSNQTDNVIASRRPCSGAGDFTIGGRSGTSDVCLDAVIDEVRISNVARSADWIKTSYNNQNDPSGFLSAGAEQSTGGANPVPELSVTILLSVGLLVLAGYVLLRRKNK